MIVECGLRNPKFEIIGFFALLLFPLLFPLTAGAQTDTTAVLVLPDPAAIEAIEVATLPSWRAAHEPRTALLRAAMVPGWGQIYNRQYYKLPFVYGGLVGLTAGALLVNNQYLLYRRSYLFLARRDENGVPDFPEFEDDFENLVDRLGRSREDVEASSATFASAFRAQRNNLRRNRDLLYVGIGLFYGLTVLDAFVSAHLVGFDVGEDLSMRVLPHPGGVAAGLHLRF